MDTSTGHLVSAEKLEELRRAMEPGAGRYVEVPQRLSKAAKQKLAGRDEAYVSMKSGGQLARWAAHERAKKVKAKRRSRARRAIEKATRRAQR